MKRQRKARPAARDLARVRVRVRVRVGVGVGVRVRIGVGVRVRVIGSASGSGCAAGDMSEVKNSRTERRRETEILYSCGKGSNWKRVCSEGCAS